MVIVVVMVKRMRAATIVTMETTRVMTDEDKGNSKGYRHE